MTEEKLLEQAKALAKQLGYIPGRLIIERALGVSQNKARRAARTLKNMDVSPDALAEHQQTNELTDDRLIDELEKRGYKLDKSIDYEPRTFKFDSQFFTGKEMRLGIVSDAHLGSKYQQITYLHKAYDFFQKEGIKIVLNLGDTFDGIKMYKGQEFEMFAQGADEQLAYGVSHYPRRKDVKTYMIAGNHDLSFIKTSGLDIVSKFAAERDDIEYLGHISRVLELGGLKIMMMHPTGGVAYARSYRLQKIIEQLAPENKPHALFSGHFHVNCQIESYRNVFGKLCGCFQAQTPYLMAKGLYPEMGFYVIKVKVQKREREVSTVQWGSDYYPFYVPIKDDY